MWCILGTIRVRVNTKMYVEIILTFASILGTMVYYWPEIETYFQKFKVKSMGLPLIREKSQIEDLYYTPEGFRQGLSRLIKITTGIEWKYSVQLFLIITVLISLFTAVITQGIVKGILRVLLVTVISLIPLVLLLAKLQTLRVRSSKEGKVLIIELLDNYKIHYYNMQHAVEVTAMTIEEAPNCKKLLFNLSKGLNRAAGSKQIRMLLDDFRYAVGTSWAGILTDNIYFALSSGLRVDMALDDLINSVAMAEEVIEKSKRENNEAGLIIKYLVPGCYILTVIGAVKFFGLTLNEFFHYQFGTEAGISWFVAIIVMYFASLIARFFLTQNKLDL